MYTVKSGDTLQSIAANELGLESSWSYLASINNITSPYAITVGQKLNTEVATVKPKKWPWLLALGATAAGGWWWYKHRQKKKKAP